MGDSGARLEYTPKLFSDELLAVMDHLVEGNDGRPVNVVAHSFGGLIATYAAARRPDRFRQFVIIDTPFFARGGLQPIRARGLRPKRIYPVLDDALHRFRLLPPQDCDNKYLIDHIARHSLRRHGGGWIWKVSCNPWDYPDFDDGLWTRVSRDLAELSCPVAFVRGELSQVCAEQMVENWRALTNGRAPVLTIPAAQHHVMLDQPLALIATLDALLSGWDPPRRRLLC